MPGQGSEAPIPAEVVIASAPPPADDIGSLRALLAHAERCWRAEEVNSTRLATRAAAALNLTVLLVTGLSGVAAHFASTYLDALRSAPRWDTFAGIIVFILGSNQALQALRLSLGARLEEGGPDTKTPFSSVALELPKETAEAPGHLSELEAHKLAFGVTYKAFLNLQGRNTTRKMQVDKAQRRAIWGIIFVAIAGGISLSVEQSTDLVWRQRNDSTSNPEHPRPESGERLEQPADSPPGPDN